MSNFETKMHQFRFPQGGLLLRGERGKRERGGEGKVRKGEGKGVAGTVSNCFLRAYYNEQKLL